MKVASRAARILNRLAKYRDITAGESDASHIPTWIHAIPIREDEICYGTYENTPGTPDETIAVTNLGLHICEGRRWRQIDYVEIRSVSIPSEKHVASELLLELQSGETYLISVAGGNEKFRDAFEFSLFLSRVIQDIKSANPG